MGEEELLARVRASWGEPTRSLLGDDAAMLELGGDWALTVDSQIAGVHYPAGLAPGRVARRLLAVNLSDLAAMGAGPAYALLALSAPAGYDHDAFFTGLRTACEEHEVTLAGGDLAASPVPVATLTLLGRRRPRGRFVRRDAGRAGDVLWVGGPLGQSALGREALAREPGGGAEPAVPTPAALRPAIDAALARHLDPQPQLELGRWLAGRRRAAALDVSDGLLKDLARLATASGVGAEVDAEALPLAAGGGELAAAWGLDAVELALSGGEDYVLLFALPEGEKPPRSFGARAIGRLREAPGLALRRGGRSDEVAPRGWDHLGGERPVGG